MGPHQNMVWGIATKRVPLRSIYEEITSKARVKEIHPSQYVHRPSPSTAIALRTVRSGFSTVAKHLVQYRVPTIFFGIKEFITITVPRVVVYHYFGMV